MYFIAYQGLYDVRHLSQNVGYLRICILYLLLSLRRTDQRSVIISCISISISTSISVGSSRRSYSPGLDVRPFGTLGALGGLLGLVRLTRLARLTLV